MNKKKSNTGLGRGTDAFFGDKADESDKAAEKKPEEKAPPKVKRMRTTITLPPDVVAAVETLRTNARKNGHRLTTSQIVEDALKAMLRKRHLL